MTVQRWPRVLPELVSERFSTSRLMSTELVLQVVQELKHMLLLEITTLNSQECVCLINNRRSHSVKRSIGPLKGAESLRTGFRRRMSRYLSLWKSQKTIGPLLSAIQRSFIWFLVFGVWLHTVQTAVSCEVLQRGGSLWVFSKAAGTLE